MRSLASGREEDMRVRAGLDWVSEWRLCLLMGDNQSEVTEALSV